MSEGRCATCRHWERDGDSDDGFCGLIVTDFDSNAPRRNPYATPTDGGSGMDRLKPWPQSGKIRLSTRAAFGCVLWEADTDAEGSR